MSVISPELMFELDALFAATAQSGKKEKAKPSKAGIQQVAPVPSLESPVPTGLNLLTEKRICNCCKGGEVVVLGVQVVYKYKGGTILKPLNTLTEVDYNRLVQSKTGSREVKQSSAVVIPHCAGCSELALDLWRESGEYVGE